VLPIDLLVARPLPRPGLDTERIAVRYADRRFDYYAAARWGAEASDVVQDLLIDSLRASAGVRTVHGHLSSFASQYMLESELRDFQAEYAQEGDLPTVRVTLVCTVGRVRDRTALATFTSSATVRAEDNSQRAVVAAFESAYREVGARVVSETLAALATAPAATPSAGT
jgi:cholesterol transport system auxiliary component